MSNPESRFFQRCFATLPECVNRILTLRDMIRLSEMIDRERWERFFRGGNFCYITNERWDGDHLVDGEAPTSKY